MHKVCRAILVSAALFSGLTAFRLLKPRAQDLGVPADGGRSTQSATGRSSGRRQALDPTSGKGNSYFAAGWSHRSKPIAQFLVHALD